MGRPDRIEERTIEQAVPRSRVRGAGRRDREGPASLRPARLVEADTNGCRISDVRRWDLERLEHILALKFLGFSLKQVRAILERTTLEWAEALRWQRKAIEDTQAHLGRALQAIRAAEHAVDSGQPVDPAILKRIIEVISVQHDIELMKKYYSEEAWERRRRYYAEGPSAEWQALYREVGALIGTDPGGEQAQEVADRWLALAVRSYTGDPDVQTDSMTAWMDREQWPPAMKRRIEAFKLEEVTAFIKQAAMSSPKQYFSEEAWARFVVLMDRGPEEVSRVWQARVDLFRDVESALGQDPAGEPAQALAARWRAQMDNTSGGDPGVKAGLMTQWADRQRWSATLRWQMVGLTMMSDERFDKAADFIDAAVAADARGAKPKLHRE
jgi:MerR family transcriptional regulator, thiopeptide resistance regulator